MTPDSNRTLIRRYYGELWNKWDLDLADELIAADVRFRGSLAVEVQGREGFKDYVRFVRAAFPDFHNRIEDLIAEGDRTVARLTYSGTHQGELFGLAATGKRISYRGMAIFRTAHGKVAEAWVFGDTLELMQQLLKPRFWETGGG